MKIFGGKTTGRKGLARDLGRLLDTGRVLSSPEDLHCYACDATHYFAFHPPDVVVFPRNPEEISRVLSYANRREVAVTTRGAGSGLSAGCTPIKGGIVIDMKGMREIVEINRGNMTARVEAGLVLADFHRAVERQKLFYPPDPQSMSVCTLGGNVATRAGGPRGVKYGTTGNYVLGLEAVLPDGEIIHAGGMCVKQSVGYDLTRLLAGSEGTLAVITKINLRLLPLPEAAKTAVAVCESVDKAAKLVAAVIAGGAIPAKMEFMNKGAAGLINAFIKNPLPLTGEGYLLFELDGAPSSIENEARKIGAIAAELGVTEMRMVDDAKEAASYWRARQNFNPVLLKIFKKMVGEDVTVPRDRVPELVAEISRISAKVGVAMGLAGHAGDGNMHPTVLLTEVNPETDRKAEQAVREIVRAALRLGGTVSGEHGVGLHKAAFIKDELGDAQIELMIRIKKAFDPRGIMNPGKIWAESSNA